MPSGVSLTGLAYVTNARQIGKSKVWFLDANFFLYRERDEKGEEKPVGICGALRYFNSPDFELAGMGLYFIHAWVGLPHSSYDLGNKESNDNRDIYEFVGDIQWMVPLHERVLGDAADDGPTVRLPRIDTEFPPYVMLSGLPFNIDKNAASFDMDIEQYTQISKGHQITMFPASCTIMNSPRWANTAKPVPFPEKYIHASGYLRAMEEKAVAGSSHSPRFKVDVDNVIWLGGTAPSTKRKDFDSTPSWVKSKARRTTDDGDAPSSSPSGTR
ncbi:hypothetical protein DFH06DRAFT_1328643 [Mycena polygramma]|nr:hypothetical protein DFH06DRAFT_1328643 [Mycena polygramma]